jgi:hypothetical protein
MTRSGYSSLVLAILLLTACHAGRQSQVHLIPKGYVGPVVILFGVPSGMDPQLDSHGATLYRIPATGILLLKSNAPPAGLYDKKYFYEAADGGREPLPYEASPGVLQVFAAVDGVTEAIDGVPTDHQRSLAYVVGVRDAGSDWARRREAATEAAIRDLHETSSGHVGDALEPRSGTAK